MANVSNKITQGIQCDFPSSLVLFQTPNFLPDPFQANASFEFHLETWQNLSFSDIFMEYRNETLALNSLINEGYVTV